MSRRFILDAVNHGTLLLEWPEQRLEHVRTLIEAEDLADETAPFLLINPRPGDDAETPKEPIRYSHEDVESACEALLEIIREEYPHMDEVAAELDEVCGDLEGLPFDEIFEPHLVG